MYGMQSSNCGLTGLLAHDRVSVSSNSRSTDGGLNLRGAKITQIVNCGTKYLMSLCAMYRTVLPIGCSSCKKKKTDSTGA